MLDVCLLPKMEQHRVSSIWCSFFKCKVWFWVVVDFYCWKIGKVCVACLGPYASVYWVQFKLSMLFMWMPKYLIKLAHFISLLNRLLSLVNMDNLWIWLRQFWLGQWWFSTCGTRVRSVWSKIRVFVLQNHLFFRGAEKCVFCKIVTSILYLSKIHEWKII